MTSESGGERIIVQLHWGKEDVPLPRPADMALAHQLIELGADLVIGHHAHCIQPFEIYKGRYIFYGLGNALFPNTEMVSYSREGRRQNNRQIKWRKWNRESLAVQYDTTAQSIEIRLLFFGDQLAVVPGARPERDYAFKGKLGARYEKKYARTVRLAMLRRLAAGFLSRPRMPKRKNLRWLIDLFKTDKTS